MNTRKWEKVDLGEAFPTPVGAYSPVLRAGPFLFVSGQIPSNPETGEIVGSDITTQTRYVIDKLSRTLAAAGASLGDVVQITAYLADINDWDEFNRTYRAAFEAPYPTRTTVGAGLHGVLVEITAVAYLG
jgi:2-iminobutanoate/2-iminopropanoate deaminase